MAWKTTKKEECPHGSDLKEGTTSNESKCNVCGETGDLRICMNCGVVACCESHKAHNRAHANESGHAIIRPHKIPDANWTWCFKCEAFLK